MNTSDMPSPPKVTSESIQKLFTEEPAATETTGPEVQMEAQVEVELKSVLPPEPEVGDESTTIDCSPETVKETSVKENLEADNEVGKLAQIKGELAEKAGQVDQVKRSELVTFLEGFAQMLRKEGADLPAPMNENKLDLTHPQLEEIRILIEDRDHEIGELRRSLVEAQDTIIKLLTDRVEDRAKIASQDMELKLIPDLQEQADRAMRLAYKTDELRADMAKVKYEIDRNRIANVRSGVYQIPQGTGIISRVKHWFLKAKGISQRQFEEFFKVKKEDSTDTKNS